MSSESPALWQINSFRKPYDTQLTPYKEKDIKIQVRSFCRQATSETTLKNGKVILVGNTGVGKTSLIRRFCQNKFHSSRGKTVGVELRLVIINILGVHFNLEIWDTAGQERFKWITTSYYRGTNVIVILFDLSEIKTLSACRDWLDETGYNNNHDFVFLVGNKVDVLTNDDYFNLKEKISSVAKKLKAEYWTVSSKTGKNVKNLFLRMALLTFQSNVLKEIGYIKGECDTSDSAINLFINGNKDITPKQTKIKNTAGGYYLVWKIMLNTNNG